MWSWCGPGRSPRPPAASPAAARHVHGSSPASSAGRLPTGRRPERSTSAPTATPRVVGGARPAGRRAGRARPVPGDGMSETILVTGADGYLGRHATRRLIEDTDARLVLAVRAHDAS